MFNNRLHLGTIFGLIFLTLSIPGFAAMIFEIDYGDIDLYFDDFIAFFVFFSLPLACSIGAFKKKIWALKLASFIIIALCFIVLLYAFYDILVNRNYEAILILIIYYLCSFCAILLLNNKWVLEQFNEAENYDDLDDDLNV